MENTMNENIKIEWFYISVNGKLRRFQSKEERDRVADQLEKEGKNVHRSWMKGIISGKNSNRLESAKVYGES